MYALLHNTSLWAGVIAWFLAQFIKLFLHIVRNHKFDPAFLFRLGGMPSSHSSGVSAIAMSVGLTYGFNDPLFAIAFALAAVVMIDAQSVRRAAGQQARLLNQIVGELFEQHRFSQQKLAEFLGHTRLEVLFGMLLGIVIALLVDATLPWHYEPP